MAQRARGKDGFTLVEALAAFAVACVVMMGVGALVHNVALTFDRGTGAVGRSERLLLAIERLARDFASARFVQRRSEAGLAAIFAAAPPNGDMPAKLVFVSAGGVLAGPQGEEVITLTIEQTHETTRLVRQRSPWTGPASHIEELTPQDSVVLLEGRFDAAFTFGRMMPDETLRWSNSWSGEFGLPRFVRLSLLDRATGATRGGDLTFPVRADAPAACAQPEAAPACLSGGSKSKVPAEGEPQRTGRANE
jgi:hypothetical protein